MTDKTYYLSTAEGIIESLDQTAVPLIDVAIACALIDLAQTLRKINLVTQQER